MANIPIWPGSSSFHPGDTPFGFYDKDPAFEKDADKVCTFVTRRLGYAGVALPLVRKVFGQIAAKEFVSVQPMNLPSGLVFYLDFQYGGTQVNSPANAANTAKQPFANGSSLYGTPSPVNPATNTSGFGNAAAGGLYGAGRFGYSTQNFIAGAATANLCIVGNADFYMDLYADSTYPFVLTGVAAAAVTGNRLSAAKMIKI